VGKDRRRGSWTDGARSGELRSAGGSKCDLFLRLGGLFESVTTEAFLLGTGAGAGEGRERRDAAAAYTGRAGPRGFCASDTRDTKLWDPDVREWYVERVEWGVGGVGIAMTSRR
jgi:hypothetical protein